MIHDRRDVFYSSRDRGRLSLFNFTLIYSILVDLSLYSTFASTVVVTRSMIAVRRLGNARLDVGCSAKGREQRKSGGCA